ncbi:hypothetical protein OSB04_031199 [Centaurea solstitialis]|uniref:Myb-like domain-containing protein n=1 Tax=Centaurea solstitialis TaxID=347529 RepID=A0AA38SL77_9ASTR|nr:hypothetical protein OSB04_031199 [Centaurea solstitialis]
MPIVNDDPSYGEKEAAVVGADNSMLLEPLISRVNDDLSCGDKGVAVANQSATEAEEVRQNVREECELPTRMEEQQLSSQGVNNCGPKSPSFNGKENGDVVTGECADMQHIQTIDLVSISVESSCSRSLRKRKLQKTRSSHLILIVNSYLRSGNDDGPLVLICSTSSIVPSSRRKTLPWTKSEEETLKNLPFFQPSQEGVQRYSSVNSKGVLWKEILEFGSNVFHKGRTLIDLKDKWRNLCK